MSITAARRQELIGKFKVHESDCGSPQVQVAILTERINGITSHLKPPHKKDHSGRRGLMQLVGLRNRLLRYLARIDRPEYLKLIQSLGLRK